MKVITKRKSLFTVIEIDGYLNFETANKLGEEIEKFIDDNSTQIIFDFHDLHFIGSSGVSSFVKMLSKLNQRANKPIYCGVKKEFLTLFKAFEGDVPFQVVDAPTADSLIKRHGP